MRQLCTLQSSRVCSWHRANSLPSSPLTSHSFTSSLRCSLCLQYNADCTTVGWIVGLFGCHAHVPTFSSYNTQSYAHTAENRSIVKKKKERKKKIYCALCQLVQPMGSTAFNTQQSHSNRIWKGVIVHMQIQSLSHSSCLLLGQQYSGRIKAHSQQITLKKTYIYMWM